MKKLVSELGDVETLSCTVDGWSDAQGRKVLALTGHWVSSNWILKDAVMGVQWVVGASTADNIQRVIDNIIGRFQETAEGNLKFVLVCMTSDGESAMTKACVDLLEDANDREYCFGHVASWHFVYFCLSFYHCLLGLNTRALELKLYQYMHCASLATSS